MSRVLCYVNFGLLLLACSPTDTGENDHLQMEVVAEPTAKRITVPSSEILYDKILGSLVGSAIGDAMGAPTEMWSREERIRSYGYVDSLDPSFIDPSPEGLWDFHLPIGATTDDTRWKLLAGDFVGKNLAGFYQDQGPDPYLFADHVLDAFDREVSRLKYSPGTDPKQIEHNVRRLTWLQEWASVAKSFSSRDTEAYTTSLHRFYGGDLLCAGMLYAPVLGLPYPGDPLQAYQAAFRLGIFDQGYARDITGLTAAMVSAAMASDRSKSSVLAVFSTVDPHDFFRSRLFGRTAFKTFRTGEYIASTAKVFEDCEEETDPVVCKIKRAFELLDHQNQHSPAHAQEILLVTLTAMLFHDFEFQGTMEFITNYGRDNDTSGAVAGAVLGAYHGYQQLPELKEQVLRTNKNNLGIDLEELAAHLTKEILLTSQNPAP